MQDKRLLRMLHKHIDILRYVFIIGGWLESWTNRNNQQYEKNDFLNDFVLEGKGLIAQVEADLKW